MKSPLLLRAGIMMVGLLWLAAPVHAADAPHDVYLPQVTQQPPSPCAAITQIPRRECEALRGFYQSVHSLPTYDLTGYWFSDDRPCGWPGVACDFNPPNPNQARTVDGILFFYSGMSGTLPPEFGRLEFAGSSAVVQQFPHRYDSKGTRAAYKAAAAQPARQPTHRRDPAELGRLTNLTILELGGNHLAGPIPPELGNLASLEDLYLSGNQLYGVVPVELAQLTHLQGLFLNNNQLTGTLPTVLGNLTGTLQLDLSSNRFSGAIPVEFSNLISLGNMNLADNQLTGTIPPALGNLTNLTGMDLSHNQLTGAIPAELGDLILLQDLRLAANQLGGPLPPALGSLTNLTGLDLSHNQLTGPLPVELARLTQLAGLDLSDNWLEGAIAGGSLTPRS